jgi:hypothetical protein
MWLFCFVVAYVIVRAWEQARAQAGAEWRRGCEHVRGEFERRMADGEAAGPQGNWWWWPAAARRAWRAMRGPRPGSRNTALPGRSPWRRLAQAARAGAARGAAEGARRAAELRAARRARRAAPGPRRAPRAPGAARRAAGGAGFAAGWVAGWARWRRWRPVQFVPVGACDNCGAVCALPSMAYQRVDVGGRTETWLLCTGCRTGNPDSAPAPPAATGAGPAAAAVTAGHPSDGPLTVRLVCTVGDLPRPAAVPAAGLSPDGSAQPVPGPADDSRAVLGDADVPVTSKRAAELEVGDLTQHAGGSCTCPEPEAPWRVEQLDPFDNGRGIDVTWSHPPCGEIAPPCPVGADCPLEFHGRSELPAAVTDVLPGELAEGASPTETSTDGNGDLMTTGRVSTELELAGNGGRLPATAGESYNYGAWQQATASDAELLDQLRLCLEAMLSGLTAVSAGRTQVANVSAWADRVSAEADLTREAIDEMDRRYRPVIGAVAAAGGPDEVSNTSYYQEI